MHRPVLSLFLGHFGHGEGEQVGDGGLLDVGDVDGLVHLALDLLHEALLSHDHLEGRLEVGLDGCGDVILVSQTLVPPSVLWLLSSLASGIRSPGTHYTMHRGCFFYGVFSSSFFFFFEMEN